MQEVKSKALVNGASVSLNANSSHDTRSQIRERLRNGIDLPYATGFHIAGNVDSPVETHDKTAPVPSNEIDQLLTDMAEIRHLTVCCLWLLHAEVLPAAAASTNS